MTPEQLDEIEKLAAAATPGPWPTPGCLQDPHGVPYGIGNDILEGTENERIAQAERDTAFIAAMREHALPLVKALREARTRCEYMEGLVDVYKGAARDWRVAKDTAALQRDEARDEVEMLRAAITRFVNKYPWQQGPEIQELKALKEGDR